MGVGLAFHIAALPGMRSVDDTSYRRIVASRIRATIRATRALAVVFVPPRVNETLVVVRNSDARDLPLLTVVTKVVSVHSC